MSSFSEGEEAEVLNQAEDILRASTQAGSISPQEEVRSKPRTQEEALLREAGKIFESTKAGTFPKTEEARKEHQTTVTVEGGKEMLKISEGFMQMGDKVAEAWAINSLNFSNRKSGFRANPGLTTSYTLGEDAYKIDIFKGNIAEDMFSCDVFAVTNGIPNIRAAVRFYGNYQKTVFPGDFVMAIDIFHTKYALDLLREGNSEDALSEMSNQLPDGINQLDAVNAPVATFFISPKGIGKTVHTPSSFTPSEGRNLTPRAHEWQTFPSKISPHDGVLLQRVLTASKAPIGL